MRLTRTFPRWLSLIISPTFVTGPTRHSRENTIETRVAKLLYILPKLHCSEQDPGALPCFSADFVLLFSRWADTDTPLLWHTWFTCSRVTLWSKFILWALSGKWLSDGTSCPLSMNRPHFTVHLVVVVDSPWWVHYCWPSKASFQILTLPFSCSYIICFLLLFPLVLNVF